MYPGNLYSSNAKNYPSNFRTYNLYLSYAHASHDLRQVNAALGSTEIGLPALQNVTVVLNTEVDNALMRKLEILAMSVMEVIRRRGDVMYKLVQKRRKRRKKMVRRITV